MILVKYMGTLAMPHICLYYVLTHGTVFYQKFLYSLIMVIYAMCWYFKDSIVTLTLNVCSVLLILTVLAVEDVKSVDFCLRFSI